MTTKVCANSKCPAYAQLVYTVAMRCVLCRCDLQPAQRAEVRSGPTDPSIREGLSRKSARTHAAG
jgi:hypothetical protein